jgi:hypothetical protein
MNGPWTFGWTQLLTIVGFVITTTIAWGGFRSIKRWRLEKLEERRIETAMESLTLAYETKFIFQHIRQIMVFSYEWADMPEHAGESDDKRNRRGAFYASIKRMNMNKDFFDRAWSLQPRCMAIFGPEVESTFEKLHKARRHIEVAAKMLSDRLDDPPVRNEDKNTKELYEQMRRDIWDHQNFEPEKDRVGKLLGEFESELVSVARPSVEQLYGKKSAGWLAGIGTRFKKK